MNTKTKNCAISKWAWLLYNFCDIESLNDDEISSNLDENSKRSLGLIEERTSANIDVLEIEVYPKQIDDLSERLMGK